MKDRDQRIYRTFEEFEREELRRAGGVGLSMHAMIDDLFAQELDFDAKASRSRSWDDEEE